MYYEFNPFLVLHEVQMAQRSPPILLDLGELLLNPVEFFLLKLLPPLFVLKKQGGLAGACH